MTRSYKLDELAQEAGVNPRTVRYYVQRGLLQPPVFRGKDTAYSEDHLLHLRAIRLLQDRFLPLDAIQSALAGLDRAGLDALLGGDAPGQAPPMVQAPVVQAPVPVAPARLWRRVTLAEGVELNVATDAPPSSARLVEDLLSLAMKRATGEE